MDKPGISEKKQNVSESTIDDLTEGSQYFHIENRKKEKKKFPISKIKQKN